MTNIIGEDATSDIDIKYVFTEEAFSKCFHFDYKKKAKSGRKMGHFTQIKKL